MIFIFADVNAAGWKMIVKSWSAFNARAWGVVRKLPRGFIRVWLVLSMCWMFGVVVDFGMAFAHVSFYANPIETYDAPMDRLQFVELAIVAVSPPLLLIWLGWALGD